MDRKRKGLTRRQLLAGAGAAVLAGAFALSVQGRTGRPTYPPSDHFDGHRFFNPRGPTGNSFSRFLKWRRTRQPGPWPERVSNTAVPRLPGRVGDAELHVTLVNHCTFLLQFPGCNLLTDPVWSDRVGPAGFIGPKRIRPPGLAWEALPRIDAVLVSHSHYDHLDVPTLRRLQERFAPKFIVGLGHRALLASHGLRDVEELDWWQPSATPVPARIRFIPAQHWSARSPFDRNTRLWGGFWIEGDRRRLYFAGDTGMTPDFVDFRERLGVPDLALLPIGAYEPRWFMGRSHLAPDEAVKAVGMLGSPRTLAMHFDTFQLGDEAFGAPERELAQALEQAGIAADRFRAPATGETVVVG